MSVRGNDAPSLSAAPPQVAERVHFGGIPFDNVDLKEAIEQIELLVRRGQPAIVVTPNVDHVIRRSEDEEYASLVDRAALVLADGQPIIWATRLLGRPLKTRVAGSDLFPALCADAASRGRRVYLLGGDPGAAEGAAEKLTARHPDLQVVGLYCPPFGFEKDAAENQRIIDAICAAQPDILFIGVGSPKQERWLAAHLAECGVPVGIGIGVSFSFVAGSVRRAPKAMQRLGLEWLHRLFQEPGRLWKRYLVRGWKFLPIVWREFWTRRPEEKQ